MSGIDYESLKNDLEIAITNHGADIQLDIDSWTIAEALAEHVFTLETLKHVREHMRDNMEQEDEQ